jgi:hypothetical protein
MSARRVLLGTVLILLTPLMGLAQPPGRLWQDGEILSRKTVLVGRTSLRSEYVYRVRGSNGRYLVVSDTALQLDLFQPMRFSIGRRHILIQDADGQERRTQILQKATLRRR